MTARDMVWAALADLDAARSLPSGTPGMSAHPLGTRSRADDDLHRLRLADRRRRAIAIAHDLVRSRLSAARRLWPQDEHIADLARVWANAAPRWKPRDQDVPAWRIAQDAVLAGGAL